MSSSRRVHFSKQKQVLKPRGVKGSGRAAVGVGERVGGGKKREGRPKAKKTWDVSS